MRRILLLLPAVLLSSPARAAERIANFRLSEIRRIFDSRNFIAPQWSPASPSQLAFSTEGFSEIWVADLQSLKLRRLAYGPGLGFHFVWSVDGRFLCGRERASDGKWQIREIRVADASSRVIGDPERHIGLPIALPSGAFAFASGKGRQWFTAGIEKALKSEAITPKTFVYQENDAIYLTTPSGPRRISEIPGRYYLPLLSPDEGKVLYEEISRGLFVYEVASGKTFAVGPGNNGCWSPDSLYVVFDLSTDDGHEVTGSEIYAVDFRGAMRTRLSHTPHLREQRPAWSADGKYIAFDADGSIYTAKILRAAEPEQRRQM